MSACKSCGAPIVWATTITGKAMPVDLEPADDGNVSLVIQGQQSPLAVVLSDEARLAYVGPLYRSHFSTCKDAASHRKAKS